MKMNKAQRREFRRLCKVWSGKVLDVLETSGAIVAVDMHSARLGLAKEVAGMMELFGDMVDKEKKT